MSLAKHIGVAIDRIFKDEESLAKFSKLEKSDGSSFRRYYMATNYSEREVCVYRDKWWSKSGGRLFVELFCFPEEYQLALSGRQQTWIEPDFNQPLHHFQYRTSNTENSMQWEIQSLEDVGRFKKELWSFLTDEGLVWFNQFDSTERVLEYLSKRNYHVDLAQMLDYLGRIDETKKEVEAYVLTLPRQNELQLERLRERSLLSTEETEFLQKASM